MALNLRGNELRGVIARLRAYREQGEEHESIAQLLGLPWEDYQELLAKFYEIETKGLRERKTEQWFLDYVLEMKRNVHDLDEVLSFYTSGEASGKQPSAAVGAIRARAEMMDRIITRGQEFGFITKRPEHHVHSGQMVHKWDEDQLRAKIEEELQGLQELAPLLPGVSARPVTILDINPGEIHRATPKTKAIAAPQDSPKSSASADARQKSKQKGPKRNKVHGGRRRVLQGGS